MRKTMAKRRYEKERLKKEYKEKKDWKMELQRYGKNRNEEMIWKSKKWIKEDMWEKEKGSKQYMEKKTEKGKRRRGKKKGRKNKEKW